MKLDNPFSSETRHLYLYSYACWECGSNGQTRGGLELHHIYGRVSSSALNSAPLCKVCHNRVGHGREEQQKYLRITIEFLAKEKYKLKPEDDQFLEYLSTTGELRGFHL
jgi:hypothetical protein